MTLRTLHVLALCAGLSLAASPSAAFNRSFAGMPTEGDSDLIAMGARHYDARTGRFLQTDPLGAAADQLYAYGASNPFLYWDPTGLAPQSIQAGFDVLEPLVNLADDSNWDPISGLPGPLKLSGTLDALLLSELADSASTSLEGLHAKVTADMALTEDRKRARRLAKLEGLNPPRPGASPAELEEWTRRGGLNRWIERIKELSPPDAELPSAAQRRIESALKVVNPIARFFETHVGRFARGGAFGYGARASLGAIGVALTVNDAARLASYVRANLETGMAMQVLESRPRN